MNIQARAWLAPALVLASLSAGVVAGAKEAPPLQSFYVAYFAFSDDLPSWYHELLDVAPVGDGVRVRLIRISLANPSCGAVIVRAVEHVFPHTTVEKVAGTDICGNTEDNVERALTLAPGHGAVTETYGETVVARCGAVEKAFSFPWPEHVDRKKLARSNPRVSALWDTFFRVRRRAFGDFAMGAASPERQRVFERLGDTLVPEITSGKYQRAFSDETCFDLPGKNCNGNYLAWRLGGYTHAPAPEERGPLAPELVEASAFRFVTYEAPVFSPIALSARLFGDVLLHLDADPETGVVKHADVISGNALLSQAAVKAATAWRFVPGTLTSPDVTVTLRFQVRCPGEPVVP